MFLATKPYTAQAVETRHADRLDWIDAAKGAAILLVVLGHCLRGLLGAGLIAEPQPYLRADGIIYMFHMHVFFILSGMFLLRQAAKSGPAAMTRRLAWRLLYPLVLWTYLFLALQTLAGDGANSPGTLLRLPLPPYAHLWFLWALFLGMLALGLTLARTPHLRKRPAAWFGAAGLAVLVWAFAPLPAAAWPWLGEFLRYLPFLALGAGLSLLPGWKSGPALPLPLCLLAFALLAAAQPALQDSMLLSALASCAAALVFLQAVKGVASRPPLARASAVLQYLGKMSMAIYLAHTAFSALVRIMLASAGVTGTGLHLAAGTAAGVLGPLVMVILLRRLKLNRALGM